MRTLLLLFLLPLASQAFLADTFQHLGNVITNAAQNLGNLIQTTAEDIATGATNIWNGVTTGVNQVVGNVVDSAGNIYGSFINTINGIQFVSTFLWDNAFGPALDMLLEGGAVFIDDKFGTILNAIGRRNVNDFMTQYHQLVTKFKTDIHQLYDELFEMEKEALVALQNGKNNLKDTIVAFENKVKSINEQIQQWAAELKSELAIHVHTVEGDFQTILTQYTKKIDLTVNTMKSMFLNLTQDLLKNLVEVALNVLPGALNIVQSLKDEGLLGFLHG
ncbi:unnamed protein product [Didymodactylos carnosus]|uniref:Uncharacterized protein n=1 Tax=Didymodactylos carnosus TaxID=1234261 RepID=A0A813TR45_9BILA|nr:unnamed protein product [Didymodactylos carnosus]CAF1501581.1 unnamed protein product [Didymodactylos carnosus]CAF3602228.1 unnamed protein product [Didymodactylos carnosus]CAF4290025.1 unnamed protein product [Didymodactylos carnosus]